MTESAASLLVKNMKDWGIQYVFGIPGKPLVPLLAECEKQNLPFVLSRHESGAGFAAAGYALLSEKLGIAVATSGPGGTNLLTAAAQAKAYHAPVLFLTAQPPTDLIGKPVGQDSSIFGTDLLKMFESVTLFNAKVERAGHLEIMLKHAVESALKGKKGPVHLSIPMDIWDTATNPFSFLLPDGRSDVLSNNLHHLVERLNRAEKAVLFLGKGVHRSRAYEEIRWLAETWNIPVMTTPGGKGTFPTNHPLSLGSYGLGGNESTKEYLQTGIDEMVVIGSKLSDMSIAGVSEAIFPSHVIQFDIDNQFIEKSLPIPTLPVIGDIKENITGLKRLMDTFHLSIKPQSYEVDAGFPHEEKMPVEISHSSSYVSAKEAIKTMRGLLPDDTILFGDDGSHSFYAIKHLCLERPGTFYFDDVFGAMGHAIGYAIGAKLAQPANTVACLTGDGCVFMHGAEIAMAVDQRLPVLFIVLNNGRLDMVEKGMTKMLGYSVGAVYNQGVDIKEYTASFGARSFQCRTIGEMKDAFEQSLEYTNGPSVIEILVDPDEIPPILDRA
ncbi:thiamine pyrophosphate-binding protein [Sediminibacillus terrae]|uniref:thiamine pyrophosphate-binding protein n=1 Tax=Sediminibacillus terrae TaxID=1562106 RepID=UPI001295FF36|nr:thiamine pyrophosphate-binding protein [Sediminibacillus terrae]